MKKIISLIIISLSLLTIVNAQSNELIINEYTYIKNEKGHKIPLNKFMTLMNSGDYVLQSKKDRFGSEYIKLKKVTKSEKEKLNDNKSNLDSPLIGEKAPDFNLIDIEGNFINSKNTKGKVVVLNFWFTTCQPCIDEISELNKIHEKYKDNKNIVFASVTFDKRNAVKTFLKKYALKYPIVTDDNTTIKHFKVSGLPTNIIIDKRGRYFNILDAGYPGIKDAIEYRIEKALRN
ncbi:TlpA disulfide reductase family protein [uncultured Lacinutrix sp.]|uniref:TlpA family protein disulfide reductase n=1 Tax=uncultured Lacinutrix sp. TaxID=574032 RepID=UPI0026034ACF|nr:TlpA disulfide reductase family protein [uncultured Lacinutrix sp.]